MLRIHGDRNSLLAALTAHWADQQLQIPEPVRPVVGRSPAPRGPGVEREGQPWQASLAGAYGHLADHLSASTAQPLPSPSTIQRRPKFLRL